MNFISSDYHTQFNYNVRNNILEVYDFKKFDANCPMGSEDENVQCLPMSNTLEMGVRGGAVG